ncbi:MAG TPA: TonB-dependent receptor [Polyangiaceae bacterium]|nr:TonB-dependent receptor [Polyangiaceae bacterium]
MKRLLSIISVLLLATLPRALQAEEAEGSSSEDDLDLVKLLNVQVSTATKTNESVDDAPAVVTVVTRDDIHRWGYRNVAEVLNHCVGFYAVDDHIQPNVGVRGVTGGLAAESSVFKVMIDGRSVAYRTTSGNWLGAELIPLQSIQQIEIIRGPASALYGADAFLGVVNIITQAPDEARPVQARVLAGATGSNPSGQFDVVGSAQAGKFDLMLGAIGEYGSRSGLTMPVESPSPDIPVYVGDRRVANNLDRRSVGLQARLGYRDRKVGQLVASAYASGFSRGGDFAPWAQLTNGTDANGNPVGTVISEGQLRLNLDGLLHASKKLDLSLQGTYFQGGVLPRDRIEVGSALYYARRKTSYRGVDSVLEARFLASSRFNLISGIETVFDHEALLAPERIIRATGDAVPDSNANDRRVNMTNVGIYMSSNLTLVERYLKLTGGIRYDNHSTYGRQITGRAGITSRLTQALAMKLLYGSAFKAPSPYLLYANPLGPGDVRGNAALKPQKIHTLEYQVSLKPNQFIGFSSGVSANWLFDKAEFSPEGINQAARNTASQTTFTWETRADAKHYDDYAAYASFELVQSKRNLGEVGYAAQLVGTANIVYPPYIARVGLSGAMPSVPSVPLTAGFEGMLVGPRHAADASVLANGAQFDLKAYATANVFLTTRDLYLIPGHESVIALRCYNLFNTSGPNPGFSAFEYPLPQREVMLELRHTY